MFSRDPLDIEALLSVTSLSLFLSDRVMSGHVPLAAKAHALGSSGEVTERQTCPHLPSTCLEEAEGFTGHHP